VQCYECGGVEHRRRDHGEIKKMKKDKIGEDKKKEIAKEEKKIEEKDRKIEKETKKIRRKIRKKRKRK